MPIFRWKCDDCAKVYERLSKYNDIIKCPECDKIMHTIMTQTSFVLRGDGWAKDGYARKGE